MRFLHHLSLLAAFGLSSNAQNATAPPTMSLLYSMSCDLGERFTINNPPNGKARYVIPIIGGTFKGPNISGKILNVGADWLLVDTHGNARPDTRYNLMTDDGDIIYVRTDGPTLKDGRILLRGRFEADAEGAYAWMNDVVGVGVLTVNGTNGVAIEMYRVDV